MILSQKAKNKEKWLRKQKHSPKSVKTKLISKFRPSIELTRKNRLNKSEVYKKASEVCNLYGISGSYVGLAAAYAPEIYETFGSQIKGLFVNCEKNKSFARQLRDYSSVISWLYAQNFLLFEGNIFDCLKQSQQQFSIIDLDLMKCLATPTKSEQDVVRPIINSLENSVTRKHLLILWSCYGMKALTEQRYDKSVRNYLLRTIVKRNKILKHLPFKYCDNHIPIKAEIFALQRRNSKINSDKNLIL